MVSEMLSSVLKKEEETAQNEKLSRAEAEKIISDARNKAKEITESAEAEADASYNEAVSNAKRDAEKQTEAAEKEATELSSQLKEKSASRLFEATQKVKEIILN